MRVVIVNAVFPPEPVVSARIGRDVAGEFAARGWQVDVITPQPSRPHGTVYPRMPASEELSAGRFRFRVHRVDSVVSPGRSLPGRFIESWSFGRKSAQKLLSLTLAAAPIDVIYVNSWPLAAQALIVAVAVRLRIPVTLHIQDLYPESLLPKLPGLFRGLAGQSLLGLDRWLMGQCRAVVTISQRMSDCVTQLRRVPRDKVVIVPNYGDGEAFKLAGARAESAARYGVDPKKFTFLYLGNIGPVAGVQTLVQAFHAAGLEKSQLLIVGGGSCRDDCEQLAKRLQAENIRFISEPDAGRVPAVQALADVFLLPMRRGAAASSVPSKLVAYLFSGRPVLAAVDEDSDTADTIRRGGCGWIEVPEDAARLGAKMREVSRLPEPALAEMGARGREHAGRHFSRARCLGDLCAVIERAANGRELQGKDGREEMARLGNLGQPGIAEASADSRT